MVQVRVILKLTIFVNTKKGETTRLFNLNDQAVRNDTSTSTIKLNKLITTKRLL